MSAVKIVVEMKICFCQALCQEVIYLSVRSSQSHLSVFCVDISKVDDSAHLRVSLNRNSHNLTVQTNIDFLVLDEHEVSLHFRFEMFSQSFLVVGNRKHLLHLWMTGYEWSRRASSCQEEQSKGIE